jgi:hypothetical protein
MAEFPDVPHQTQRLVWLAISVTQVAGMAENILINL